MQSQIDLKDILRTLNNRIGLIIGVFVLFVVMSIIISYSIAPTYQASATLRIKQKQGLGNSLLSEIPGGNNLTKELMSTYAEMLKSRAVVQVVIDKTWRAKKVGDVAPTVSDFALLITTTPIRDTQILKVSVTGGEPQIAQLRTNTLVEAFLDRLAKLSQEDQRSVREFIGVRLGEIKTDLDKTEAVLTEYKAANKIISPDDEAQAVLDNLKELDKAQANNIVATTSAQAQLRIANSQLESESPGFVASSPLIEQLKGKIADLEVQKMMLLQQYTSKHPQVQTIQAAIDEARSNLNSEANNIVMARAPSSNPVHIALIQAKIQSEASVEAGKAQSVAIKGEVDKRLNALTAMPDKQAKLVRLTRDAKVTEQMYIALVHLDVGADLGQDGVDFVLDFRILGFESSLFNSFFHGVRG